ncbi:galactose-binding domain-like protein [Sphaerosporella brunnea]|uniref:Galactose-binding domain-like protein n=1 Tax=Sphaerosporella brunnea TaxID=1250544 RepID=A0A5J5FB89_9PEZI|nr:galactose-binding domain-like protein [Sphaerosporella brunnea]
MAHIERIDESKAQETFGTSCVDLISSALGGQVLSFTDQFFADAANLINPAAPIRKPGYFVETGAWYDGWETRRHNREPADWVIVKLGVPSGKVHGVEIDTAFFSGNHAPAVSVEGDTVWETILPRQECGPSQRHACSHVRLNMYPDGGIARFRLFGTVVPVFPTDPESIIDLAHVANGGLAVSCSDQHFGTRHNLLLPGRGNNMGGEVIANTLHFRGNFPQAIEVYAINRDEHEDARWELIDTEHAFPSTMLQNTQDKMVSHVKLVIIPDGGVKRLRVFGKRALKA